MLSSEADNSEVLPFGAFILSVYTQLIVMWEVTMNMQMVRYVNLAFRLGGIVCFWFFYCFLEVW